MLLRQSRDKSESARRQVLVNRLLLVVEMRKRKTQSKVCLVIQIPKKVVELELIQIPKKVVVSKLIQIQFRSQKLMSQFLKVHMKNHSLQESKVVVTVLKNLSHGKM